MPASPRESGPRPGDSVPAPRPRPAFEHVDRRLVVAHAPQDARGDDFGAGLRIELRAPFAVGGIPHGVALAEPAPLDRGDPEHPERVGRQLRSADTVEQVAPGSGSTQRGGDVRGGTCRAGCGERRRAASAVSAARGPTAPARTGGSRCVPAHATDDIVGPPSASRSRTSRLCPRPPLMSLPLPTLGSGVLAGLPHGDGRLQGVCPAAQVDDGEMAGGSAARARCPASRSRRTTRPGTAAPTPTGSSRRTRGPNASPARWRCTAPVTRRRSRRSCR